MSAWEDNLNHLEEIEKLNRLASANEEKLGQFAKEDVGEYDDSEMQDYVENRLTDSETDHKITENENEEEEKIKTIFMVNKHKSINIYYVNKRFLLCVMNAKSNKNGS